MTTIRTASQLLWTHIGSPAHRDCGEIDVTEPCWLCADMLGPGTCCPKGQRVDDWQRANFTGQNRVRCSESLHVCEACIHICGRLAVVPGRPPRADGGIATNFRCYSHLYDATRYVSASKGEKPVIRAFLEAEKQGPWFAAIGESGQKHTLPWTPVNPGGGTVGVVMFEERTTRWHAGNERMLAEMMALLTAGATKDELFTGRFTPRAWQLCREQLERFEAAYGQLRGGTAYALCLWLAQRDEEVVAERMAAEKAAKAAKKVRPTSKTKAAAKAAKAAMKIEAAQTAAKGRNGKAKRGAARAAAHQDCGAAPRAAAVVSAEPAGEHAEALGNPAEPDAERSAPLSEPGRVGHEHAERHANSVGQLSLFGGDCEPGRCRARGRRLA
jgi:hypothetical protein